MHRKNTEAFVTRGTKTRENDRRESQLVGRFCGYLEKQGRKFGRKQISLAGSVQPLFTDVYIGDEDVLVEAKGTVSRQAVRLAIGQLFDYQRFISPKSCAILLPQRPSDDLVSLIKSVGFAVIWEAADGAFVSEGADLGEARE